MEESILLYPAAIPVMLWGMALMLLRFTADDKKGWLVTEAAVILLYLIFWIVVVMPLGVAREKFTEITIFFSATRQHWIVSFGFLVVSSIGWKVWRRRQPENNIHKVITKILEILFGLFIVGCIGGMFYVMYVMGELGAVVIGLLVVTVLMGVFLGLFQLLQKLSDRYNL